MIRQFGVACVLIFHLGVAWGEEPLEGFDSFVEQSLRDFQVPGAAVAVVHDDKVVFLKGFGVREAGKPAKVDPDTLFMLASVSKTFTAGLVGTFVDDGVIDWDDPVINHLPEMMLHDEYATRHATYRDFLAHRSGLPAFVGDLLESQDYSRPEILRRIRFIEPGCSFREQANYSNPGIFIAGMAAARLGGKTWDELIEERLFQPLKMTRSGTKQTDWKRTDNYATNHMVIDDELQAIVWEPYDAMGPAGSITSTARDLAQWMRLQLGDGTVDGRRVLSAETIKEMHTPAMVETPGFAEAPPINEESGFSFGLGWGVYHYNGYQIIEKGGARAGVRSVVMLIPEKNVGVAVLANRNLTYQPEAVRGWILEAYAGQAKEDFQEKIQQAGKAAEQLFNTPQPKGATENGPSVPLKALAGAYENDLYGRLEIILKDEKLSWKTGPSEFGAGVTHTGYDNFLLQFPEGIIAIPEPVTFIIDETGKPVRLATETYGTFDRVAVPEDDIVAEGP